MARKKIIFVIVEGPSDEEALGVILSKYFENDEVYVEIMHCDITSMDGVNPTNIIQKITSVVKEYAERYHFKPLHFKNIIHIVDTDGAFAPDSCIVEDSSVNGFLYSESEIRVSNREQAISRNKQKSQNLLKISRTESIWKIPYNVFYMSCDLEHVLFNKLNCSDEEKENLSFKFAKKYKDDIPGFINFISNSPFSIKDDYLSSWKFIENDGNSLKRYTNFALCFTLQKNNLPTK